MNILERRTAIISSVRNDEREQLENGITYDEDQARQATVHTRQDVVLLNAQLDELIGEVRGTRRWIIAGVIAGVLLFLLTR